MSVIDEKDAPTPIGKVKEEGESEAFIPYPAIGKNLEHVPIHVRPDVLYYLQRMTFFPNAIKLYLHVPWIAEHLFKLNNSIMRDERNGLSEHFKYRLALLASYENQCPYCVSHHACTLERRWGYADDKVAQVIEQEPPADEREAVAMEFVRVASRNDAAVNDDLRARLAQHFTPQEVMEIVLVTGFWKMYNMMHVAMAVPIEDPVQEYKRWVEYNREPGK